MSGFLTQREADALFAMEKHRVNEDRVELPDQGGNITVPLASSDGSESFFLDISRGRLNLAKGKIQNRTRSVVVLARIDFGGAPHRNPDDQEIPCPHLHIYREGFGDRWAIPAPEDIFSDTTDHWQTLKDFMRFCNVTVQPNFTKGLFT